MKQITCCLFLASILAFAGFATGVAQDIPSAKPAPVPRPAVESPAKPPSAKSPSAPDRAKPPKPVSVPKPAQAAPVKPQASPSGVQPGTKRNEKGPKSGATQTPQRPPLAGPRPAAGSDQRGQRNDRPGATPTTPSPGPQSPRDGGAPRGGHQHDSLRNDDSRRSQLGISIGPGGVQIFRGNPGPGIGGRQPWPQYYGRDFRNGPGDHWHPQGSPYRWYPDRGWGAVIDTRPSGPVSRPVIITQSPVAQPAAPQVPSSPPVPTNDEVAGMPGAELRGLLLFAVDRLKEDLDGISTGASWKSYLQIDELRRLVPPPTQAPPAPDSDPTVVQEAAAEPLIPEAVRRRLADTLLRYDSVHQNAEYRAISRLWGFQTTRVVLRELLIPPIQRVQKQLALSVELLDQELRQFETGATWTKHLKLDEAKRIATIRPSELSAKDKGQLQMMISAFDAVSAEPRYRMISDLLGFRLTQHVTRSYVAQLKVTAPPAPSAVQ